MHDLWYNSPRYNKVRCDMAKNKFYVTYSFMTRHGLIGGRNPIPGISIGLLPVVAKVLFLSRRMYLTVYGDMDLSTVITKSSRYFDNSYFSRLLVHGDFRCSQYSKVFPAAVYGTFDCSRMDKGWIDKDFRFPLTEKINCAYSINSFSDLMGLLPENLEFLIVEPKLIKKDFLNQHVDDVNDFLDAYPEVTVCDTHGKKLDDVIVEIVEENKHKSQAFVEYKARKEELKQRFQIICEKLQEYADLYPEKTNEIEYYFHNIFRPTLKSLTTLDTLADFFTKTESVIVTPQRFFMELEEIFKTEGKHLDIQDLFVRFRSDPEFNELSDDELNRFVRYALSNQRNNGIKKKIVHRLKDDIDVTCVFVSEFPQIRADLKNIIIESKEKRLEKPEAEKTPTVETPVVVPEVAKDVIKPITIKKYITESQYKKVVKSSGKKNALDVLHIINEINQNPLDMQFQGSVHVIKDGQTTVSKTAKKEFECTIVQSIDSSNHNDNKRLVWQVADGPTGLILVCVGFVSVHDKAKSKANKIYNDLLKQARKKQTYTAADLANYMEVEEIIRKEGGLPDTDLSLIGDTINPYDTGR